MNFTPFSLTLWVRLLVAGMLFPHSGLAQLQGTAPEGHNFGEINQLAQVGSSVSLIASVTSDSPMTLSWTKDGHLLHDADALTLTLPMVTKENAGTYRLKARNPFGFWESPPFLVAVYETGTEEVTLEAGKSLRLEPHAWGA